MFLGEIDSHSHQVSSLSFIPLASAQYLSLVIHITPHTSNEELCTYLTKEIQKRGNHCIFRFRILGKRNPQTSFAFDSLLKQFRISEIIDETEPNYHLNSLYMEHSGDMLGFYIQSMQKTNMSSVEKKALHYGIQALLHTAEKRG